MILASQSPRRKKILEELGFNIKVLKPDIEEISDANKIEEIVMDISRKKCKEIAKNNKTEYILGADTVVYCNDEILGKPVNKENARKMLEKLSGKTHKVITGYCILNENLGIEVTGVETTLVTFKKLSKEKIEWYILTNEYLDKAGSYGIQGKGSVLVSYIQGDYFSVMGLPIGKIVDEFEKLGFTMSKLNKI